MEKKTKPVAPFGGKVKNKIITFFTCVVLIFVNLFIFSFPSYGAEYKYYKNKIQLAQTKDDDNIIKKTLDKYLNELEKKRILYLFNRNANKFII